MSGFFLDSNVLVYAYTQHDPRQTRAKDLVNRGGTISVQCLNEFATVAQRKLSMSWSELTESISIIIDLTDRVIPLDITIHRLGRRLSEERRLAVYDGMIVAAALIANCDTLYSEDMHDGLVIEDRLRIANPFAQAAG